MVFDFTVRALRRWSGANAVHVSVFHVHAKPRDAGSPESVGSTTGSSQSSPCMCAFKEAAVRYAFKALDIVEPSSEWGDPIIRMPRLPGTQMQSPLRAFGTPEAVIVSHITTPREWATSWDNREPHVFARWDQGLGGQPGAWLRSNWWNRNMESRYQDCRCELSDGTRCKYCYPDDNECKERVTEEGMKYNEECTCSIVWHGLWTRPNVSFDREVPTMEGSDAPPPECREEEFDNPAPNADDPAWSLVSEDCDTANVQSALQLLQLHGNLTGLKIGCVSGGRTRRVADLDALNKAVFEGFRNSQTEDEMDRGETVSGLMSAFDLSGTEGDTLSAIMMVNRSFINGDSWARFDRSMSQLSSLMNGFVQQRLAADGVGTATWTDSPMVAIRKFPGNPPYGIPFDFATGAGAIMTVIAVTFQASTLVETLVDEKVARIRVMMRMSGLKGWAYWLVTYCFWATIILSQGWLYLLIVTYSVLPFGYRVSIFIFTDGGVQFILFFLYGLTLASLCFLASALIGNVVTARTLMLCFKVMLGIVGGQLSPVFTDPAVAPFVKTIVSLFPPLGLLRAVLSMTDYAAKTVDPVKDSSPMLEWPAVLEGRSPVGEVMLIFLFEAPLFLLLTYYLDQVSGNFGVHRHPLFFLGLSYALPPQQVHDPENTAGRPKDVEEEEARVATMNGLPAYQQDAVLIHGLRKVFPGHPPKAAVQNLTVGVKRGECMGFLGPNGAGKTTTINMLCGFFQPTQGTANVEGLNITSQMERIYTIMGVCPQHDIHWGLLSAKQHLLFYARLKNIPSTELEQSVKVALGAVNLLDRMNEPVHTFSGGMKRRLSVAMSLIGKPLVCYLDEPSSGLDPASRRQLWRCIEQSKASRSIMLTTHSMEEAEGLCDRVGIFVGGELRCIGAPQELKMRFGDTLNLTVTTTTANDHTSWLEDTVRQISDKANCTYRLDKQHKYELPANGVSLGKIFSTLIQAREDGKVLSFGITSATLEDVFIKIATKG
mmetsp:Transcript_15168/g.38033  ORF Transcript_15168/g.38033 Transcript_15168/m.38033 type:complete len:997 (+) Transcript_15168:4616-7606(+)